MERNARTARSRKVSRQKGDIMRDVLISLKPYYYYLIGEGIKRVEVRKTYPKAEDWSRNSWFYMSRDEKSFAKIPKEFQEKYRKHFGKVGMRFVCDRIDKIINLVPIYTLVQSCLTTEQIREYLNGKNGYGWHITDLVVYGEPRELSDFTHECNRVCVDTKKQIKCERITVDGFSCNGLKPISRPPMSWQFCVVEEPRQTAD